MATISYKGPRPLGVKITSYIVVGVIIYFFQNIDKSPLHDGDIKNWLVFLAPALGPLFMAAMDFISKKPSLNDAAANKPIE
jgi:hypothetical protein